MLYEMATGWRIFTGTNHASLAAAILEPGVQMDPVSSPDGKMVAYAAEPGGNVDLFVKQVTAAKKLEWGSAGDAPVRITDDPLPDWQPDWSPDPPADTPPLIWRTISLGDGAHRDADLSPAALERVGAAALDGVISVEWAPSGAQRGHRGTSFFGSSAESVG